MNIPVGATHYQPLQCAYYKEQGHGYFLVWSRCEKEEPYQWLDSPGTCGKFLVKLC